MARVSDNVERIKSRQSEARGYMHAMPYCSCAVCRTPYARALCAGLAPKWRSSMSGKQKTILIGRSCMAERGVVPRPDSLCKGQSRVEDAARNVHTVRVQDLSRSISVRTGGLSTSPEHQTRASSYVNPLWPT